MTMAAADEGAERSLERVSLRQRTWRRACAAGAFAVGAVIVAASVGAYQGRLPEFIHAKNFDKLAHFSFAGTFAFFFDGALGYRKAFRRAPSWLHLGPLAYFVVAAIEEWAQRFSPLRSSDILDLTADALGIVLLAWASTKIDRRLAR